MIMDAENYSGEKPPEIISSLRVRCPDCQKIVSFDLSDLPRLREFHTSNFQCPLCNFWIRIDFFVSPSWLNSFRFEKDEKSQK